MHKIKTTVSQGILRGPSVSYDKKYTAFIYYIFITVKHYGKYKIHTLQTVNHVTEGNLQVTPLKKVAILV